MTTSTLDGAHFLLLASDLWTDVPTVVGIFATDTHAVEAARSAIQDADPGTERYVLEEWLGTVRRSSTTIAALLDGAEFDEEDASDTTVSQDHCRSSLRA